MTLRVTLRVTILGCGSSGGVPRVGGDWGVCDPNEPKNRRTRCSLLVEQWEGDVEPDNQEKTVILIDTSPDLREQLLKAKVTKIDAVLYTCLLYTSPSPRDATLSRMPSSA